MGDCGGYEYVEDVAECGRSAVKGEPGRKASDGCLGDEVGRLKASCVEEIAVRLDWRVFLDDDEKRLANQLIAVDGEHGRDGCLGWLRLSVAIQVGLL